MENQVALPSGMKLFAPSPAPSDSVPENKSMTMRDRVPQIANDRLDMFRLIMAEAEAIVSAKRAALEEAIRLDRTTDALSDQLSKAQQRAGSSRSIVEQCMEWLGSRNHYRSYRAAKMPGVRKFSQAALDNTRNHVDRIRDEISTVSIAPVPNEERKTALLAQLEQYRSIGRPNIGVDGLIQPVHPDALLQFVCWLLPEAIWNERIDQIIGPEPQNALSSADKAKRLASLRSDLTVAEVNEVAIIDASDGQAHYRPSTSISALLHLEAI